MANVKWTEAAQSVLSTAQNLIDNFHPVLSRARICFVFRSEAQKQGNRMIVGGACKVPDKMQPFLEYDFLIWLSEEDYTGMDDLRREALIDHELCHCAGDPINGWKLRPHDIQEFSDVIKRHGVWSSDVMAAKIAIDYYQTQTLPGLMIDSLSKLDMPTGTVFTVKGRELDKASMALEE